MICLKKYSTKILLCRRDLLNIVCSNNSRIKILQKAVNNMKQQYTNKKLHNTKGYIRLVRGLRVKDIKTKRIHSVIIFLYLTLKINLVCVCCTIMVIKSDYSVEEMP